MRSFMIQSLWVALWESSLARFLILVCLPFGLGGARADSVTDPSILTTQTGNSPSTGKLTIYVRIPISADFVSRVSSFYVEW